MTVDMDLVRDLVETAVAWLDDLDMDGVRVMQMAKSNLYEALEEMEYGARFDEGQGEADP